MNYLPEPFDVVSARLTSTRFAARNHGPRAALAEFAYFTALADATSYASGRDVFVLDRRTGTWTRCQRQELIAGPVTKSNRRSGYLQYNDIHLDVHALLTWLTAQQAGISSEDDLGIQIDDTWRAGDVDNADTVRALLDYLSHERPTILNDLQGRVIDFLYAEDSYAFAVTLPGDRHRPPLTLLDDWNELRHLGDSDLAGIDAVVAVINEAVTVTNVLTEDLNHRTSPSTLLSAQRITHVLQTIEHLDQDTANSSTVTCRECSKTLPDDSKCEFAEHGQHDPDQVLWNPDSEEKDVREIDVAFSVRVPNDGYNYATDITGRLEQMLNLLLLHPLVSAASTRSGARGHTRSGYDGESDVLFP